MIINYDEFKMCFKIAAEKFITEKDIIEKTKRYLSAFQKVKEELYQKNCFKEVEELSNSEKTDISFH